MNVLLKVLGWSLRASAATCIVWITVHVLQGDPGYATLAGLLSGVAFHAVFALVGVQLLGLARRREGADAPAQA